MAEFVERKRWVFLGLPFTFTKYRIGDELITVESGFLNRKEDDCYMYKVTDVRLERSFFERIVGIGTVVCITGDNTHPELRLLHIKNSKAIKDFILAQSETERQKHRVLNTMGIGHAGVAGDLDGDGIPDDLQ